MHGAFHASPLTALNCTSFVSQCGILSNEGLTPAEEEERAMLRGAYIEEFRSNLKIQLENTYIVDENGNKRKVKRKK